MQGQDCRAKRRPHRRQRYSRAFQARRIKVCQREASLADLSFKWACESECAELKVHSRIFLPRWPSTRHLEKWPPAAQRNRGCACRIRTGRFHGSRSGAVPERRADERAFRRGRKLRHGFRRGRFRAGGPRLVSTWPTILRESPRQSRHAPPLWSAALVAEKTLPPESFAAPPELHLPLCSRNPRPFSPGVRTPRPRPCVRADGLRLARLGFRRSGFRAEGPYRLRWSLLQSFGPGICAPFPSRNPHPFRTSCGL